MKKGEIVEGVIERSQFPNKGIKNMKNGTASEKQYRGRR